VALLITGAAADAQAPSGSAKQWFVPPPGRPLAPSIDMHGDEHWEQITVTAKRRPVPVLSDLNEADFSRPAQSDAASPGFSFMKTLPYCQSAYHDVAGQPATGMTAPLVAGSCE